MWSWLDPNGYTVLARFDYVPGAGAIAAVLLIAGGLLRPLRSRLDLSAVVAGVVGKRAIVTGASSGIGIGLAVARALHAEGAQVEMLARSADRLRTAAAGVGTPLVADTAEDSSVRAAVAAVADLFGGVDVLVNTAARATPPGGVPAPLRSPTTTSAPRSR